jgi:nucleoside 2-deoxyribosyltransferase
MIYLASPYSDPNPVVMEERFRAACIAAGELMNQGLVVFSPIAHTHPIAVACNLPRGWDYWHQFDLEFIRAADALIVLRLPGWNKSKGIDGELSIARDLCIPIDFIDP